MIEDTEGVRLLVSNIRLQGRRTQINILGTGTFSETIQAQRRCLIEVVEPGKVVQEKVDKRRCLLKLGMSWFLCWLFVGNIMIFVSFLCWPRSCSKTRISQFSTTMAGGLLLLLLDNNFITLFIVAAMLLAVVACLRLNNLKTWTKTKKNNVYLEIIITIFVVVDTLLAIVACVSMKEQTNKQTNKQKFFGQFLLVSPYLSSEWKLQQKTSTMTWRRERWSLRRESWQLTTKRESSQNLSDLSLFEKKHPKFEQFNWK